MEKRAIEKKRGDSVQSPFFVRILSRCASLHLTELLEKKLYISA